MAAAEAEAADVVAADVVAAGSKQQVTGEGLEKLINEQGLKNPPTTNAGQLESTSKRLQKLKEDFFKDKFLINKILLILEKFLKIHIKNQIDNGANIIQIFDSWAGLLENKISELKFLVNSVSKSK